jgi:hypothetical protein
MTYSEFKKKWLGKGINFDGAYGNQCMDVYRQYVKEVLGYPQSKPVKGAKDVWSTYLPEGYERITNDPKAIPQQGDVIIWGHGTYGHIAICDSANVNSFISFEQNWTELDGSGVTELRKHDYKNVLGWLRPKRSDTINPDEQKPVTMEFTDQTRIPLGGELGEPELQAVRSMIKDASKVAKELQELKEVHETYVKRQESKEMDYKTELATVTDTNTLYREAIVRMAKRGGVTQNIEFVEAAYNSTFKENEDLRKKLENINDNRPVVKSPFEELGHQLSELVKLIIKSLKKWLKIK